MAVYFGTDRLEQAIMTNQAAPEHDNVTTTTTNWLERFGGGLNTAVDQFLPTFLDAFRQVKDVEAHYSEAYAGLQGVAGLRRPEHLAGFAASPTTAAVPASTAYQPVSHEQQAPAAAGSMSVVPLLIGVGVVVLGVSLIGRG